jgi:type II secretory pathway pseudopilin PulG
MRNQKGITLIALVITIIVLLILAGVSIAMLTGNNGILTKANNATEATGQAEAEEAVKLALATILANKNDPTYSGSVNEVTFTNIQTIIAGDNSSAVVTDASESSSTDIVIKYKASSNAKEYTVTVDSTTGKIK